MMLHQQFADELRELAPCLFGLMGDGNMYLVDSYVRGGGRYVSAAHEAGAVAMAGGYAQATGRTGFATVTHGPGLTNTVTALVDAVRAHLRLVVITGGVPPAHRGSLQRIDQRAVAESAGARYLAAESSAGALDSLALACEFAIAECCPVVLDVRADLWWAPSIDRPIAPLAPRASVASDVDAADLDRAVGLIAASDRPVVLAGAGAVSEPARDASVRLAQRIGAPLATTLRAKGLFTGEECAIGVFGTLSTDGALDVVRASDCIVAIGASLTPWTTVDGALLEGKRIVQIDERPTAIGQFIEVTASVVGDLPEVIDQIITMLDTVEVPPARFRSSLMRRQPDAPTDARAAGAATSEAAVSVDLTAFLRRLDSTFSDNRILVCDSGRYVGQALRWLRNGGLGSYVHTQAFGSIGLGMGYAVGAAAGRPDRPTLLAVGDGGFMLGGLAEFNTAVRHGLDLTVVVLNDGCYGAEYEQLQARGMDPSLSRFSWPDLAAVATSLGGTGLRVRTASDVEPALAQLAEARRPALVDVVLDPAAQPLLTRV
jgi:thiamine pyrophosphate-dependent acetolactate synthase large subunit-like protein